METEREREKEKQKQSIGKTAQIHFLAKMVT